jgi:hypothetical protein
MHYRGFRLVSSHGQVYDCLHGLIEDSVKGRRLGVETTKLLLTGQTHCPFNLIFMI